MSRKKPKTPKDQPPPPAPVPDDAADQPAADSGEDAADVDELTALQAERDDLFARLQRLAADFQNYQKNKQRDVEQARQFAREDLIRSLLTVLDHMELALQAAREHGDGEDSPLRTGMQMVHDEALGVLKKYGLEPIEAVGQPFDPDCHAAMMAEPTDTCPPGTVLAELQKGYRLGERTLRPSGVKVAAEPVAEPAADQAPDTAEPDSAEDEPS